MMKKCHLLLYLCVLLMSFSSYKALAQAAKPMPTLGPADPWNETGLMQPADLAQIITTGKSEGYFIINIGAVEDIKGARHIGPVSNAENMGKLKSMAANLPKNTPFIVYCGCCPFNKCPNIRPAFKELSAMGFTNVKLLNLKVNLQTNWISKGYPVVKN